MAVDFAQLLERANSKGWALVVLDVEIDTTTATGRMIANSLMNFAEFERRVIGERTKTALAVKRRQGVRLGRPVNHSGEGGRAGAA